MATLNAEKPDLTTGLVLLENEVEFQRENGASASALAALEWSLETIKKLLKEVDGDA